MGVVLALAGSGPLVMKLAASMQPSRVLSCHAQIVRRQGLVRTLWLANHSTLVLFSGDTDERTCPVSGTLVEKRSGELSYRLDGKLAPLWSNLGNFVLLLGGALLAATVLLGRGGTAEWRWTVGRHAFPLVHVNLGAESLLPPHTRGEAIGLLAIGRSAVGLVAVGPLATGAISVGLLTAGVLES